MQVWAGVRNKYFEYAEKIDLEDELDHFTECKTNGANPHMDGLSFEDYIHEGTWNDDQLESANGFHFLFGWAECCDQLRYMTIDMTDAVWFVEHRDD